MVKYTQGNMTIENVYKWEKRIGTNDGVDIACVQTVLSVCVCVYSSVARCDVWKR